MIYDEGTEVPTIHDGPDAWWRFHDNIVRLAYWLAENGSSAKDVAHAVEKPWKWGNEYIAARHDITEADLLLFIDEYGEDDLEKHIVAAIIKEELS